MSYMVGPDGVVYVVRSNEEARELYRELLEDEGSEQ